MSLDKTDFENILLEDLVELVDGKVPEGQRLEYKSALYGDTDGDKLEMLKDVSSFANSLGGHLIIGLREENGIPVSLDGIEIFDLDAEILKIENRISSSIQPRVQNIRIKALALGNDHFCIIIRIPKSWRPPHRVIFQGKNRFHARNSAGVYEPDVEELRVLFNTGLQVQEKIRVFRDERLSLVLAGHGPRELSSTEGRLILHLIPFASLVADIQIDLKKAKELATHFSPIERDGLRPRFNIDGFINLRGTDDNLGYTQVFRNGIIESTFAEISFVTGTRRCISSVRFESALLENLTSYIEGLRLLDVPLPLAVVATIEGVNGFEYITSAPQFAIHPIEPFRQDVVYLPQVVIENYGSVADYHRAVKPMIDALWNAAGYPEAQCFTGENGLWVRNREVIE